MKLYLTKAFSTNNAFYILIPSFEGLYVLYLLSFANLLPFAFNFISIYCDLHAFLHQLFYLTKYWKYTAEIYEREIGIFFIYKNYEYLSLVYVNV